LLTLHLRNCSATGHRVERLAGFHAAQTCNELVTLLEKGFFVNTAQAGRKVWILLVVGIEILSTDHNVSFVCGGVLFSVLGVGVSVYKRCQVPVTFTRRFRDFLRSIFGGALVRFL